MPYSAENIATFKLLNENTSSESRQGSNPERSGMLQCAAKGPQTIHQRLSGRKVCINFLSFTPFTQKRDIVFASGVKYLHRVMLFNQSKVRN